MEPEEFNLKEQEEFETSNGLTLDDLGGNYISAPKVGDTHVIFTVQKIVKIEGQKILGKTSDGKTFKKNLSNVEFGYEIHTKDNRKYTISAWEVFGKLKSIFQRCQKIAGTEIRITHLLDGMKPENKDKDCYEVAAKVDGSWKTLDRSTQEWKSA